MQFTLQTLLIAFVVVGLCLGTFGAAGLLVAGSILVITKIIRSSKSMLRTTFLGGFLLFLMPAFFSWAIIKAPEAREAARESCCLGRIFQLNFALRNYEFTNGSIPSSTLVLRDDKPRYSWRVEILPFVEQLKLYSQYNFNEPWDGPHNSRLSKMPLFWLRCPSDPITGSTCETNYVAVTGPNTVWPEKGEISSKDIPDGAENTIRLIEMHDSGINWLEPRDFSLAQWTPENKEKILAKIAPHRRRPAWYYKEQQFGNVAFADGHYASLSKEVLAEYLPVLCSRNGGEEVDLEKLTAPELDWSRLCSLFGLAVSTLVLIYRPRRGRRGTTEKMDPAEPDRVGPGG